MAVVWLRKWAALSRMPSLLTPPHARDLAGQAIAGTWAHRQPCSAASQPQLLPQLHDAGAATAARAAVPWHPQVQVLPGHGLQEQEEVSTWFMEGSETLVANPLVRAVNSADRGSAGLERNG